MCVCVGGAGLFARNYRKCFALPLFVSDKVAKTANSCILKVSARSASVGLCVFMCVASLAARRFAVLRPRTFHPCSQYVHCACYLIVLVNSLYPFWRWEGRGEYE